MKKKEKKGEALTLVHEVISLLEKADEKIKAALSICYDAESDLYKYAENGDMDLLLSSLADLLRVIADVWDTVPQVVTVEHKAAKLFADAAYKYRQLK
jgi:hypothetical protein